MTKRTGNIKANIVKQLKSLFSDNPFAGGLGNRENDMIAYIHGGMSLEKVFFIDKASKIQQMSRTDKVLSYTEMIEHIDDYFPYHFCPKKSYL